MRTTFTQEQMEDLLEYIGADKIGFWKGDKIQCCCPVHGETNPSFGVNIDFTPDDNPNQHMAVCHCFSCGFSGTIPWLLVNTIPDECKNIKDAEQWIRDRYGISFTYGTDENGNFVVRRFEDKYDIKPKERFVVPRTKLAPFKSGKETYQYFFDRGFDKEDMKKFMIGRDLINETVTIPAFYEDGELAGIIGRYIDPSRPKNSRFKIYSFPKGSLIYPLNHLQAVNDTLIGVESMLDCIMLHKWGYPNAFAIMGDAFTKQQADMVAKRCRKFIPLFDRDAGGDTALSSAKRWLKGRVQVIEPTYTPKKGKDPCEWGEIETIKVINSATAKKRISRL